MPFSLMQQATFYKQVVTEKTRWEGGVVYYDDQVITYEPFKGAKEGYRDGETSLVLPAKTSTSTAYMLSTNEKLTTYVNTGDKTKADKIYLENPEDNPNAKQYYVRAVEEWDTGEGFTFLADHYMYLIIGQETE
ncbi:hypothetical protein [Vibrio phage RYC]|nr:hypothetical protein [Vibrio phage RYC]